MPITVEGWQCLAYQIKLNWSLASESHCKGSSTSSLESMLEDKDMMRPLGDISWLESVLLSFLQCSDTWLGDWKGIWHIEPVPFISKCYLPEQVENKAE